MKVCSSEETIRLEIYRAVSVAKKEVHGSLIKRSKKRKSIDQTRRSIDLLHNEWTIDQSEFVEPTRISSNRKKVFYRSPFLSVVSLVSNELPSFCFSCRPRKQIKRNLSLYVETTIDRRQGKCDLFSLVSFCQTNRRQFSCWFIDFSNRISICSLEINLLARANRIRLVSFDRRSFHSKSDLTERTARETVMSWEMELDENLLEDLYIWIDSLPLSRPKKRIERDFSDGKTQFDSIDRLQTVFLFVFACQEFLSLRSFDIICRIR